jgi:hypothetical protein
MPTFAVRQHPSLHSYCHDEPVIQYLLSLLWLTVSHHTFPHVNISLSNWSNGMRHQQSTFRESWIPQKMCTKMCATLCNTLIYIYIYIYNITVNHVQIMILGYYNCYIRKCCFDKLKA